MSPVDCLQDLPKSQDVRSRRVFFLPGFDPLPPRRYRELYRKEGKRQAEISGYELSISAGEGRPYHWFIDGRIDGQDTRTRYEFLEWHDIVQEQIRYNILQSYVRMYATLLHYLISGAFRAMIRLRPTTIFAASYSVVMLHLYLISALLLGWLGAWLVGLTGLPPWCGAMAGLIIGMSWMVVLRRADRKLFVYYLLFDYLYTASERGAYPAALNDRLSEFAERINRALEEESDEVLVIGHSSGAHLAASVLARVGTSEDQRLSFLTLGQAIPMLSFLPGASALRRDLNQLSTRSDLFWLDVSAPGDGACFALSDPVAVSGAAPTSGQTNPLVISAAFRHTMSSEQLQYLRWRFFHRHIQYLSAFDRPKDYDFFQITAGPLSLETRYEDRAPSPSKITKVFAPVPGF